MFNQSTVFRALMAMTVCNLVFPIQLVANERTTSGDCPQERKTLPAPKEFLKKTSPLRKEPRHLKKGKVLAHIKAKPIACKNCHGMDGDGQGAMSPNMMPKPRNFTCGPMMQEISDGQLFWIIKNGSKGTSMPAYQHLSDEKVWQLILYIRSLGEN